MWWACNESDRCNNFLKTVKKVLEGSQLIDTSQRTYLRSCIRWAIWFLEVKVPSPYGIFVRVPKRVAMEGPRRCIVRLDGLLA